MDYGEFVRMLLRRWIENFTRFWRLYEEDFDVSCIFCFCERFLKYTSISQHIGRFLKGLFENHSWSLCWTCVSPSAMARCQVFLILRFPPISNLWHLCRSRLIALHTARSSAVTCVSVWSETSTNHFNLFLISEAFIPWASVWRFNRDFTITVLVTC